MSRADGLRRHLWWAAPRGTTSGDAGRTRPPAPAGPEWSAPRRRAITGYSGKARPRTLPGGFLSRGPPLLVVQNAYRSPA